MPHRSYILRQAGLDDGVLGKVLALPGVFHASVVIAAGDLQLRRQHREVRLHRDLTAALDGNLFTMRNKSTRRFSAELTMKSASALANRETKGYINARRFTSII